MAESIAAGLIVAIMSLVFISSHTSTRSPKKSQHNTVDLARAVPEKRILDLRPYDSTRGDQERNRGKGPLALERVVFDLTIQLPLGMAEGKYLFDLVDSSGVQRLEASGEATIIDYVTTARTTFDLRGFSPGPFTLAVRRVNRSVLISCPIEIR